MLAHVKRVVNLIGMSIRVPGRRVAGQPLRWNGGLHQLCQRCSLVLGEGAVTAPAPVGCVNTAVADGDATDATTGEAAIAGQLDSGDHVFPTLCHWNACRGLITARRRSEQEEPGGHRRRHPVSGHVRLLFMHRTARLLVSVSLFAVVSASAADKPDVVVKYRQNVMKAMAAHMSAMAAISRGQITDRGQFAGHAAALQSLSRELPDLFPPDSAPEHVRSAAKREIWQRPAEFRAATTALSTASDRLYLASGRKDASSRSAAFENAGAQCGSCHKSFRQHDSD